MGAASDALGLGANALTRITQGTSIFGGSLIDMTLCPRLVNALMDAEGGVALTQPLLAFVGDSTMAGTRSTGDLKTNSWPAQMLPLLAPFMALDENGFYGNQTTNNTIAELVAYDPRISAGTGVAIDTAFSLGGYAVALDNATGPLTFTPTKAYDTLDLITSCGGTTSTIGVQFGSGTVTNYPMNALNITKTTITKTLGTEPVVLTKATGAPRVQAITLRNSTAPKVMLANMAKAGSASTDWAQTYTPGAGRAPMAALATVNPVAALVVLGVNDWSNGVAVATYAANMQTIINSIKSYADVILGVPFPSNISAYPTQGQYVAALKSLAASNNLPLIDLARPLVSYEVSQPLGRYVDNRHLSTVRGYKMISKFGAREFRALLNI
jgi:hypothetical protein